MKKTVFIFLCMLFVASYSHATVSVGCFADGKSTANSGRMLPTRAALYFDVVDFNARTDKVMTIRELNGNIFVKTDREDNGPFTSENSYRGYFDAKVLRSNPKYKPRRYTNFVQFNLNAAKTDGFEEGMWGQLLVEKKIDDEFEAKYIFRAGDHMGGTVHLDCVINDMTE